MDKMYLCSEAEPLLVKKIREWGYATDHLENYKGASCFATRNPVYVYLKEGQDEESLQAEIEKARQEVEQDKYALFDKYFGEESIDKQKVYATVLTGCDFHRQRKVNEDKYEEIASVVWTYTRDSRDGRDHTYKTVMIDKEAMMKDKRREITLYVPKALIGHIVGKGGEKIKSLGKKYGKFFKVKQDPREQYQEKLDALSDLYYGTLNGSCEKFEERYAQLTETLQDVSWLHEDDKIKFEEKYKEAIEKRKNNFAEEKAEFLHEQAIEKRSGELQKFSRGLEKSLPELSNEEIEAKMTSFISERGSSWGVPFTEEEVVKIQTQLQKRRDKARKYAYDKKFKAVAGEEALVGVDNETLEKRIAEKGRDVIVSDVWERVIVTLNDEEMAKLTSDLVQERDKQEKETQDKMLTEILRSIEWQEIEKMRCLTEEEVKTALQEFNQRMHKERPEAELLLLTVNDAVVVQKKKDRIQRQKDIETLKRNYYEVVAEEITNRNGEIHRSAGCSNGSKSRLYHALSEKNSGIRIWPSINITPDEVKDDESLIQHNVSYMEDYYVRPDIEDNGGYYDSSRCYYRSGQSDTKEKCESFSGSKKAENSDKKETPPEIRTNKKGCMISNDFEALKDMLQKRK